MSKETEFSDRANGWPDTVNAINFKNQKTHSHITYTYPVLILRVLKGHFWPLENKICLKILFNSSLSFPLNISFICLKMCI